LSAVFHFTDYKQNQEQRVTTRYFDPEENGLNFNDFYTQAEQKTRIYSGKLDFETNFGKMNFGSGLKVSRVDSDSGLNFFDIENGSLNFNTMLSDLFLYEETVFAGYIEISRKWNKWNTKLGLRGEQTERSGESVSMLETNDRNYFELFPTAYIAYQFSENHRLAFDYGRKIDRPNYEALNPFKYFIDEHNFKSGNPNLTASISNDFNLNYTYKKAYSFDLYFRDNGNNIAKLVFQDNEAMTLRSVQMNVQDSKSYGLDFLHGRSIKKWWYAQVYASIFHEEETYWAVESDFPLVTNEMDALYFSLYNGLDLSKDDTFSGDLTLYYLSDFIEGSYKMHDIFNLSFGLRKKLWKNRAEISLRVGDIFNTTAVPLYTTYGNQDNGFFSHPENRYIKVGFKLNFGNFHLSDNERSNGTEERKRL
ncbi:MAG TPA: outer membrane beta-barrel family protein, partial [Flavobacteriaceae bacterium]|nr:outer membrane beta-barrel family protein [Flavobacteriaceae bacterium]